MSRTTDLLHTPTVRRAAALGLVVAVAALFAVNLRRAGHPEGDDVALYLRQARSLLDGDPSAVVADNRFAVLTSDPLFSPIAYPWGWPIVLSPFVGWWGLAYDRLKLVEIAVFCIWLVGVHGIVRRRLGRVPAFATVAALATAPAYLAHTGQLLSEIPHLLAVALVVSWYDRIRARYTLLTAPRRDLVVLGLLTTAAFNVRRESAVLIVVFAVVQLVDVWRDAPRRRPLELARAVRRSLPALVTPLVTFAVAATLFQLLLPTDVLPDNGNGSEFVGDRWGEYPGILADQLGLGGSGAVGVVVLLVALAGAIVGVRRRPALDTPLVLLALLLALVVGTHPRQIDRYWLQVTPWVVYFAVVALVAVATRIAFGRGSVMSRDRADRLRGRAQLGAAAPLLALVAAHVVVLAGDLGDARDFNASGAVQDGPAHPAVVEVMAAVEQVTPTDAVVAYYRARTLTLLTDRRSFQTRDVERIRANADYWVQRRDWSFWQPGLEVAAVDALGFTEVWSSDRFVIWETGR